MSDESCDMIWYCAGDGQYGQHGPGRGQAQHVNHHHLQACHHDHPGTQHNVQHDHIELVTSLTYDTTLTFFSWIILTHVAVITRDIFYSTNFGWFNQAEDPKEEKI